MDIYSKKAENEHKHGLCCHLQHVSDIVPFNILAQEKQINYYWALTPKDVGMLRCALIKQNVIILKYTQFAKAPVWNIPYVYRFIGNRW